MKLYIDGDEIDPNSINYTFGQIDGEIVSMELSGRLQDAHWLNTPRSHVYGILIGTDDTVVDMPEILRGQLDLDRSVINSDGTFRAYMSRCKCPVGRVQYK